MSKILILNTGLNGEKSNSNKFTDMYQKIRQLSSIEDEVTIRDLNEQALSHLSSEEMQAWMTPSQERNEQQNLLAKLSDDLITELFAHDIIVIGMPMYNMGIPSTFKAYIDRVARAGKTFKYTETGPIGLVENKQIVVLAARGGMYQGTPLDTQTGYLKSIFGLMGIEKVDFIYAEGLNMGEEVAQNAWLKANEQLMASV